MQLIVESSTTAGDSTQGVCVCVCVRNRFPLTSKETLTPFAFCVVESSILFIFILFSAMTRQF